MLAEVKLLMEDKISGDREKGEETPTTKTKCVPLRGVCTRRLAARAAARRASARAALHWARGAPFCAAGSEASGPAPRRSASVFGKTYSYVTRFSYPNATVETAQSIRECVHNQP